ncbi:unnamed protein product [Prorocentrum cordatum]|uniref:Uncharacterized protein n=1 Tax=Prorocentrum cordatum TaxID=2364126 RepID=A0ABN9Q758_9DINO|nr:unnamed protein product [Polarella glacialis]
MAAATAAASGPWAATPQVRGVLVADAPGGARPCDRASAGWVAPGNPDREARIRLWSPPVSRGKLQELESLLSEDVPALLGLAFLDPSCRGASDEAAAAVEALVAKPGYGGFMSSA